MRRRMCLLAVVGCVLGALAAATADAQTKAGSPMATSETQVTRLTATVEAVDVQKRMLTLKGSDGQPRTIHVDEQVKNLPQVKVGDRVILEYHESLAIELREPTEAERANPKTVEAMAGTAPAGQKPAAGAGRRVRAVVTITAIDAGKQTVTIKGPEGNTLTVKARDPKNLAKVKVGDTLVVTYTEALAVAVRPATQ
ncbi:MAG TPA: hypothetical protein VLD61_10170 [Methylomirabilota bacterium]|nr:hypothetical protein [Methylomirabilota bacterium]